MKKIDTPSSQKRTHIYEIDLIRAITVFTVVVNHSLSYTNFLITNPAAVQLVNLIIHTLHYNREMFMFITGLVLTYVYYHRPFSVKSFWLTRFSLVFIPYVLWSIIYVVINNHSRTFIEYLRLSLWNILTGEASFQLYYILLSLQFYAIFPLFLMFIKKVAHYPWRTLAISFILQILILYADFYYLQSGPFSRIRAVNTFIHYQDRILLMYEFFFILGGFAAIYMNTMQAFFAKYGRCIFLLFITTLGLYTLYFYTQLNQFHLSIGLASSVLQPSVAVYSSVVILFFFYLAFIWAKNRKWFGLIKIISDTSFGIYFVHVLFLTYIVKYLLPLLPAAIAAPIKMISVLLIAFMSSVIFCFLLLKIPFLSWTIGRMKK